MMGAPFGGAGGSGRVPGPERDAASEERMLASVAYLLWPLALPVLLDAGQVPRSAWLKKHARQAVVLGLISWGVLFIVFSLSLFLILAAAVPFEATIGLYQFSFLLDLVIFGFAVALAVQAARRASRGDEFDLYALLPIPIKKDR